MDAVTIITAMSPMFSAAALVLVAVIETGNRRDRKRTEARSARRAEESRLSMEMMSANNKLSLVTAKKVMGHQTNGDVEDAMQAALRAQQEYEDFKTRLAAGQVAKY